jgi:hypothetical protein
MMGKQVDPILLAILPTAVEGTEVRSETELHNFPQQPSSGRETTGSESGTAVGGVQQIIDHAAMIWVRLMGRHELDLSRQNALPICQSDGLSARRGRRAAPSARPQAPDA